MLTIAATTFSVCVTDPVRNLLARQTSWSLWRVCHRPGAPRDHRGRVVVSVVDCASPPRVGYTSREPPETDLARIWDVPVYEDARVARTSASSASSNFSASGASASGRLRTSRMCPIRKPSAPTESQPAVPPCPGCHDSAFVRQEQVLTGGTAISFWTCTSCLRSWPAPKPRMAKADLNRSK